jgi:alpha-galactosidase
MIGTSPIVLAYFGCITVISQCSLSWQNLTKKGKIARNSTGYAIIDEQKFPDMAGLATYGQSKGVSMGFYSDNCHGHEKTGPTHYQQDAHLSEALGFDAIKIDSCGNQRNMTEWASLFAKEDHPMLVESCGNGPSGTNPKHDDVPMAAWVTMLADTCPFSFYRVSVDVAPQFHSCVYNMNRVLPYLAPKAPLSRPGCWAYPGG